MMDLSKVKDLYEKSLDEHGRKPESVGWTKPGSQYMRFDKLMAVVENPEEPFSVNELGCGYGELLPYCLKHSLNLKDYFGYDISSKMIEEAKQHLAEYSDWKLFEESKIFTRTDYTTTSGIFNVRFKESEEDWKVFVFDTLRHMFEMSDKGISFNLLSTYVDYKVDHLFYANPLEFFDFCKNEFSKYVSLLHDYPLYEWTILVRKNNE